MGVVDAVERRRDPRQLDDLPGGRVVARHVEEPGREAERPLVHGPPDQRAHLVELGRRGRAVVLADHPSPDLAVTRVGERVHPDAALEPGEQVVDVGRAPAVHANRHRGDALMEERQRVPAVVLRQLGVRVHVDEAGRDHQPVDVHDRGGVEAGRRRVAHEADALSRHADVLADRGLSRAVVDETADQQEVGGRLGAEVGDPGGPQHRHRGQERPVPPAHVKVVPDRHDGVLKPLPRRGVSSLRSPPTDIARASTRGTREKRGRTAAVTGPESRPRRTGCWGSRD